MLHPCRIAEFCVCFIFLATIRRACSCTHLARGDSTSLCGVAFFSVAGRSTTNLAFATLDGYTASENADGNRPTDCPCSHQHFL
ncbi:hypothetical protein GDO78_013579 [Eleutherodactylus coqui]|uniref:Secreted protein n=1 Tax=Eleutherodactylus coqui TaxID=57060 RepID=A0A8J6EPP2_ELECQ|nr:hypothetical protein GDO78_013579 [Eleutherodactylus coqui]